MMTEIRHSCMLTSNVLDTCS